MVVAIPRAANASCTACFWPAVAWLTVVWAAWLKVTSGVKPNCELMISRSAAVAPSALRMP